MLAVKDDTDTWRMMLPVVNTALLRLVISNLSLSARTQTEQASRGAYFHRLIRALYKHWPAADSPPRRGTTGRSEPVRASSDRSCRAGRVENPAGHVEAGFRATRLRPIRRQPRARPGLRLPGGRRPALGVAGGGHEARRIRAADMGGRCRFRAQRHMGRLA